MKKVPKIQNIMRISAIFLFLCIFTAYAEKTYSQYARVNIQESQLTIGEFIDQIENQTDYLFVYSKNELDTNEEISVKSGSKTVVQYLDEVFRNTDLKYVFENDYIVLTLNKAPSLPDIQQNKRQISGVVTDEAGEPVIGANVIEKGTTNGVITDFDGKFSLSVSENAIIQISYLGYVAQEVSVVGQTNLSILLKEDTQALDEVVVTGFGLSQKKATLTGAISSITSKDIERSKASTTSGALIGKVAGLNTRQVNGEPGQAASMNIRNMGTPLYVIDGMQCDEGQFNNLDFNDIESISVLKDASAAIYGMRAANGVIVVTTKRGQKNTKNTVSVNGYYGWQTLNGFAKPADALTYVTTIVQSETVQGGNRTITKEDYAKWQAGTEKGYQGFDWADYIWRTAPQYYANVNASGGTDKANYYISIGHLQQDAMIRNYDGFNRTNIQMNVDMQITDRLKIGASINGRVEQRKNPASTTSTTTSVYYIPRWSMYQNKPTLRPYANDNPDYPQYTSPYAMTNFSLHTLDVLGYISNISRVMQLNGNIEYDIWDGLKIKGLFGYFFSYNLYNRHQYAYNLYAYEPGTDTYKTQTGSAVGNRYRSTSHSETLTSNIQLAYNKQLGSHKVDAVAGFEAIKTDNPGFSLNARPVSNIIDLIDYNTLTGFSDWKQSRASARLGWLGRVNYDYANKYLLELSARYDGSWKFPPDHRWGFFPSGSIGWRISEEAFWQNSKLSSVFNDFKIRGSYGVVGDDNVSGYGNFDHLAGYLYNAAGSVIDGEFVIGSQAKGLPVKTLSWMKAKMLDIGFDAAFLNNRLTAQADYFRRLRTGLPDSRYDVVIPTEVGFSLPKENLNSDLHKGFDFAIQWRDKIGDFNYSVGGNMTYARYYNWEQYKPRFGNSWEYYRNSANHRVANITWGYEIEGQFQNWEEIASHPVNIDRQGNRTMRPGDLIYKDVNNDGVINTMDQRPIGYAQGSTPIINFGLNFAFGWKGFDLAFDLTGGALSSWRRQYEAVNPFHGDGNNPQFYMEDAWHLADIWDADSEYLPGKHPMIIKGNDGHSNYDWLRTNTAWMINTKYMKLRNLEFGYTFPKKWLSKVMISDLRLYFSGTNLFILTNTFETDPETVNDAGLDYPGSRVMNLGINIKF